MDDLDNRKTTIKSTGFVNFPDDHYLLRFEYCKAMQKPLSVSQYIQINDMMGRIKDCHKYLCGNQREDIKARFSGSPFFVTDKYRLALAPHYY